ncbi:MAG: hypothetical protein FJW79_01155 [Actinobacteria bacterium]|nr:hypothetical protein [Actinomycetota bacterium]
MTAALVLALVLLADPVPGDGIRLAPDPRLPAVGAGSPVPGGPTVPPLPAAVGGAVAGLAALAATRARGRRGAGEARGEAEGEEPLVVFVSGHGSASAPGVFSHLVALMGLDSDRARYFDYRWADGGREHGRASEQASIDETADALDGYLAGLNESGRPVYLVGFSKGGAGIAELVARWDRGEPGAAHGVIGAALLDPPMASGFHGWLQSLGTLWGPIPDDGGYDPIRCDLRGCVDTRRHLGRASGVEVMVVRNPQAAITNFADVPEGLRVYEASDGKPGFLPTLLTRPWQVGSRVAEAHLAVLYDPRVAACIAAATAGSESCSLPLVGQRPAAGVVVHGPGSALKVPLNRVL